MDIVDLVTQNIVRHCESATIRLLYQALDAEPERVRAMLYTHFKTLRPDEAQDQCGFSDDLLIVTEAISVVVEELQGEVWVEDEWEVAEFPARGKAEEFLEWLDRHTEVEFPSENVLRDPQLDKDVWLVRYR